MGIALATDEPLTRRRTAWMPAGLPQIRGKWLIGYRVLWLVGMLMALASVTVLRFDLEAQRESDALAVYGVGLTPTLQDSAGLRVSPFSAQSRLEGIRDNDLLLRVDGQGSPAAQPEVFERLLRGPEGSTAQVTVQHADGQTVTVSLIRSTSYLRAAYAGTGFTWKFRRHTEFAIELIGDLLGLVVAAMLFLRRTGDPVSAMISFGIVINSINFIAVFGPSATLLQIIVSNVATGLTIGGVLFFPDGLLSPRWWWVAAMTAALALLAAVLSYFGAVPELAWELLLLTTLALSVAAVVQRYRAGISGTAQQQTKFAVLGFVGTLLGISIGLAAQQALILTTSQTARIYLILLSNLGIAIGSLMFALGLLIALLRYRLYDADTVIGRSAAYGVLTLGFIALFAGTEKLAELIGERYFEHSIGIAAGAIGAAIAAACVVPLHNLVHRWAERRFRKPLIRMREGLPECVDDLRDTASVDEIADAVMKRVEAGVRSTREAVLLRDKAGWKISGARHVDTAKVGAWQMKWMIGDDGLNALDRQDPLFPVRVRLCIERADETEILGWLLLGPRPDGSFFGKDEREALAHVAGPIARAIHVAQLRQDREQRAEQRLSALEALVAKLAKARGGGRSAATA